MAAIANVRHALFVNKSAIFANAAFRFSFIDSKPMRKEIHFLPKQELSQVLLSPPVKPKAVRNGYNVFISEQIKVMREQSNTQAVKDIIKLAADKWKSMSDHQKNKYALKARDQSKAQAQEVTEYNVLMTSPVKLSDVINVIADIAKTAKKERSQLKKTTARGLFYHEEAQKNKGLKLNEFSERWNALSEDKKKEYKAAAEKINKETEERIRQWKEKYKFMY